MQHTCKTYGQLNSGHLADIGMWECLKTLLDIPATLAVINMLALVHRHHHRHHKHQQKVLEFEYNQAIMR